MSIHLVVCSSVGSRPPFRGEEGIMNGNGNLLEFDCTLSPNILHMIAIKL